MSGSRREKLRILILDDHPGVRQGVRQILTERFRPLEFDEGKAGLESLELALGQPWDLVIVSVDLPDREGLKVLSELKRISPDQPILVLTLRVGHFEVANTPDEMVSAVRRLIAGGTSGPSTGAIEVSRDPERWCGRPSHENLSNREREVLRLIGSCKTVKEIAAALALSEKTIGTYRSRILIKLELKTTAELVRYAVMNRLAD
jgi:two-component system invasion response regulator UvrY